jgi:uncharacterized protein (TIGR03086 family)
MSDRQPGVVAANDSETSVRRSVTVDVDRERAFSVFTEGIDSWWNRAYHIGTVKMDVAVIELREGGRWYERGVDGSECDWGYVITWEPPSRIVLAWQINGQWHYDPDLVTEVDVKFTGEGASRTRVDLEHRHLDRFGDSAAQIRAIFDSDDGWPGLLRLYAGQAAASGDEAMDLIDLFDRATAWTATKVAGAQHDLDGATPCDEWNVRRLIDHLLAGQQMFAAGPSGGTVAPPEGPPPELVGNDPATQYEQARTATIEAYAQPGTLAGTVRGGAGDVPAAQIVAIAFCDQLIHGWDLARATGQDTTMPADLAAVAWQMLDGRISDDARGSGKNFKAAVPTPESANDQDKLIGYCGRTP